MDKQIRELERRLASGDESARPQLARARRRAGVVRRRLSGYLLSKIGREFVAWRTPDGRCPQGEFIRAAGDHRIRIARWGNRCGKTVVGTIDVLLACLGWHPTFPHKPPITVWVSALDWNMIGRVIWKCMASDGGGPGWLPMQEVDGEIAWLRKTPPQPKAIRFRNGSTIDFKSADSGRSKYQGAKCHLIWLDEEHPPDVVEECEARLVDFGGHLNVTATPIMRARWLQDLEKRASVFVNRASMLDAGRAGVISLEAVEAYADSLPERQRRVRVYGDLVALEGAVYPSFDVDTHVAKPRDGWIWIGDRRVAEWPLPASWPRYAAADFGVSHPMAVPRAAHDGTAGRLIVERCWWSSGIRYSRWAKHLKSELANLAAPLICDRDSDGRACFEAAGISTTAASKDRVQPGLEVVEWLLEPAKDGLPKLVLVEDGSLLHPVLGRSDCKRLSYELGNYHYPKEGEGPLRADLPVKKDDDCADALRYLCVKIVEWLSQGYGPDPDDGLGDQIRPWS